MGMVEEGAKVESYYKKRPMWAPKGSETMPVIVTFTEEEARNLPEWGESLNEEEVRRFKIPAGGVATETPVITPGMGAKVSRIPIKVREAKGDVYYYELDPIKGGLKGTEVDLEKDFGFAPKSTLPQMPKFPEWKFPKIGFPNLNIGMPEIGVGAKAGIGIGLLFLGGIVLLIAIGYSGMGESAGRVGEKVYSKKRK